MILFNKGETYPNLPGLVWKSNCPLNVLTGFASLSSKNWNQVLMITGNASFISLWMNFGPLFFTEMFWFGNTGEFSSMNSLFKASAKAFWTKSRQNLHVFFWAIHRWTEVVCCGSLSCSISQVCLSFRAQTDGQTSGFSGGGQNSWSHQL